MSNIIDTTDKLITALWAIGPETAAALPPAERRRLVEALEAAHRATKGEAIVADARKAAEPEGVLHALKRGDRAP